MVTEIKTNKIAEMLERKLKQSKEQVIEQERMLKLAKKLTEILPESLQEIEWYTLYKTYYKPRYHLETSFFSDTNQADKIIKDLKIFGVQNWKTRYSGGRWIHTGEFQFKGIIIEIEVDGGGQPATCRLETTTEMKEVTTTKVICNETGDEL